VTEWLCSGLLNREAKVSTWVRFPPGVPMSLNKEEKEVLLSLLKDAYEDEIEHLRLRMIRDTQAPRFKDLEESHPEIYADFMKARTGPHEILLKNRNRRVEVLKLLIENH
jgi:DNA repair photolyase